MYQKAVSSYLKKSYKLEIKEEFSQKIGKNFYICDGERNILHETSFQNYLEKYFGFRKAYCKLNLKYRCFF